MSKRFPLKHDPAKTVIIGRKPVDFDKLFAQYKTNTRKKIVKGKVLRISAGVETRFSSKIEHYVALMTQDVSSKIAALFNSYEMKYHIESLRGDTGMDASIGSQARILTNAFMKQFDKLFGALSQTLAANMVAEVNENSKQQTQSSLFDIGQTLALDPALLGPANLEILKASVEKAVDFIQTIPKRYLASVNDAVLSSITTGNGLADLQPFLDKQNVSITNWARNTALDQTRKTFNNLNLGRMSKIGVKRGEWIHSGGSQHPRPLHQDYDGKIFNLNEGAPVGDDGGNNVWPGEEPNCRCTFTPVLDDLFNQNEDEA